MMVLVCPPGSVSSAAVSRSCQISRTAVAAVKPLCEPTTPAGAPRKTAAAGGTANRATTLNAAQSAQQAVCRARPPARHAAQAEASHTAAAPSAQHPHCPRVTHCRMAPPASMCWALSWAGRTRSGTTRSFRQQLCNSQWATCMGPWTRRSHRSLPEMST